AAKDREGGSAPSIGDPAPLSSASQQKPQTILVPVRVDGGGNYLGGNVFDDVSKFAKKATKGVVGTVKWVRKNQPLSKINKFLRDTHLKCAVGSILGIGFKINEGLDKAEAKGWGKRGGHACGRQMRLIQMNKYSN